MKSYSITKFKKTLINLGLKSNDNVLLVPELFRLGKLENVNNVEEYYSTILNTISKIIGPKNHRKIVEKYVSRKGPKSISLDSGHLD